MYAKIFRHFIQKFDHPTHEKNQVSSTNERKEFKVGSSNLSNTADGEEHGKHLLHLTPGVKFIPL